jgi:hypothetical protein
MNFSYELLQIRTNERIAQLRQEAETERSLRQKAKQALQVLASARLKQSRPATEAPSQRSA